MHWSQTESSKWSLESLFNHLGRPFIREKCYNLPDPGVQHTPPAHVKGPVQLGELLGGRVIWRGSLEWGARGLNKVYNIIQPEWVTGRKVGLALEAAGVHPKE